MKEKGYYEEKLEESAATSIDMEEVHKTRLKQLGKQFKFGFGQKNADFNLLLKVMNDSEKLGKHLKDFITIYKYYQYLGKGGKIEDYLKESNIDISVLLPEYNMVNEEKQNKAKLKSVCDEDEEPEIGVNFLNQLLDNGMDQLTAIDQLKEDITVSAELVEMKCDITKSVFKKSVGLKAQKLAGKDISEKVKAIEQQSDQFSEVAELL